MRKISELLKIGKVQLREKGFKLYALEAEILLAELICNGKREGLLSLLDDEFGEALREKYLKLIKRREMFEPISHLIGRKCFWDYDFKVNSEVLTPRADSECIIQAIMKCFPNVNQTLKVLDLGTGSGCLAITVAKLYKNSFIIASDISEPALNIAKENATLNQVIDRISIVKSNWFQKLQLGVKFDIIMSNPPYIALEEMDSLAPEVRNFEPYIALTDYKDGLSNYRRIAEKASLYLKQNGKGFFEMGFGQAKQVSKIFTDLGYKVSNIVKDLSGIDRCIIIYNE